MQVPACCAAIYGHNVEECVAIDVRFNMTGLYQYLRNSVADNTAASEPRTGACTSAVITDQTTRLHRFEPWCLMLARYR